MLDPMQVLEQTDELTVTHMCEAAAIPAPSGAEEQRGRWLAERLLEIGLPPKQDDVGNVWAVSPAAQPGADRLVIAAHLDSVFPLEADLTITRSGERLSAPGISDNVRGLAGMLALGRALSAADWPLRVPLVLLGTVGEEGVGDLRGVKRFIEQHGATTAAFIALDGAGSARIVNAGVGSRRLRVRYTGPGGHSWSDFGAPNALHALGRAVAALADIALPRQPRTTLSVGRGGGGTSINAIPAEAWLELDLRSDQREPLLELEARARAALEAARVAEGGSAGGLNMQIELFGDRPAGRTAPDHPLVHSAIAATRMIGNTPELTSSSTDANVPMAAAIPAIGIGAGGEAGGTHTLNEWYENRGGVRGLQRALRIILDVAG